MTAHQAPPSLGFSRQEHWSGLPFPSPMHESGKWKWSCSVMSDSQRPHGLQPTRLLHPWDFPGNSTGVGCHCLLRKTYIYGLNSMWLEKRSYENRRGNLHFSLDIFSIIWIFSCNFNKYKEIKKIPNWISSTKSLFPWKGNIHVFQALGPGYLWEPRIIFPRRGFGTN